MLVDGEGIRLTLLAEAEAAVEVEDEDDNFGGMRCEPGARVLDPVSL